MNSEKSISHKGEYWGHWWLPENPDKKVIGKLTISYNNKATLELHGFLQDNLEDNLNFILSIVLGSSSDGKLITLNRCVLLEASIHSSETSKVLL